MDWYKAKNIIIVVLVAINLYLLYSIWGYFHDGGIAKETLTDTVQILKERGIELDCKLPATRGSLPKLAYSDSKFEIYRIASMLLDGQPVNSEQTQKSMSIASKSVDIESSIELEYWDTAPQSKVDIHQRTEVEKYTKEFLRKHGLNSSEFIVDSYSEIQGTVKIAFVGRFRDYYIYGNRIFVDVTANGVNYLHYIYRKAEGFSSDDSINIMPIHEILLKNLNSGPSTTIKHIDLGYKALAPYDENAKEYYENPAWRIVLKDGSERFFQGNNGKEIK